MIVATAIIIILFSEVHGFVGNKGVTESDCVDRHRQALEEENGLSVVS